jgi:endoglucanase
MHAFGMQMCYIMGASGHSYVVGFGCNPPRNPHHYDSALTLRESGRMEVFKSRSHNASPLIGALVGGPNAKDVWRDDRTDMNGNGVALDYNAAMLLGLVQCAC